MHSRTTHPCRPFSGSSAGLRQIGIWLGDQQQLTAAARVEPSILLPLSVFLLSSRTSCDRYSFISILTSASRISVYIPSMVRLKELAPLLFHNLGDGSTFCHAPWDQCKASAGKWLVTGRFATGIQKHVLVSGKCPAFRKQRVRTFLLHFSLQEPPSRRSPEKGFD